MPHWGRAADFSSAGRQAGSFAPTRSADSIRHLPGGGVRTGRAAGRCRLTARHGTSSRNGDAGRLRDTVACRARHRTRGHARGPRRRRDRAHQGDRGLHPGQEAHADAGKRHAGSVRRRLRRTGRARRGDSPVPDVGLVPGEDFFSPVRARAPSTGGGSCARSRTPPRDTDHSGRQPVARGFSRRGSIRGRFLIPLVWRRINAFTQLRVVG